MKLNYTRAEAQVVSLPAEDVIRTSGDPEAPVILSSKRLNDGVYGHQDGLRKLP